jgi:uncharacterized protein YndB with AHSA1/START domain
MTSQQTALSVSTPSEREIRLEREFDAPRERVFAVMIDPALISEWWGPRGTTTTVDEMDVRPGGAWRYVVRNQDGSETAFRGIYREIAAPERIVQTFEWEPMAGRVSVETTTFEDLGEQTKVTTVSIFHTASERDSMLGSGMEWGLNQTYERFDEVLERLSDR